MARSKKKMYRRRYDAGTASAIEYDVVDRHSIADVVKRIELRAKTGHALSLSSTEVRQLQGLLLSLAQTTDGQERTINALKMGLMAQRQLVGEGEESKKPLRRRFRRPSKPVEPASVL